MARFLTTGLDVRSVLTEAVHRLVSLHDVSDLTPSTSATRFRRNVRQVLT
jgi:hypothetical protein